MATTHLEAAALSDAELRAILAAARHAAEFDLFGTRVRLRASAPGPIAAARRELGVFEVAPDPQRPPAAEVVAAVEESPGPRATFVAGSSAWRLDGEDLVERAGAVLALMAEARVRTAFLAHAGCVSLGGRGVVIAAPSRMGKSTLTAHLAVRGAGLLSDELAPLERASGLVLPAPFPVGIRPGAGEPLLAGKEAADFAFRSDRKKLVDVLELTGRQPSAPVRPDVVIFLTTRAEPSVRTLTKHGGRVRLTLTGWSGQLGAALEALPWLRLHSRTEEDGLVPVVVELEEPEARMPALLRLIGEQGVGLAGVRFESLDEPDFDAEPSLLRLPAAAGVMEFAKKVIPQQVRELVAGEFGGRMAPLIEELARLLRGAACYKLTPGRLESMLRLIEGLA